MNRLTRLLAVLLCLLPGAALAELPTLENATLHTRLNIGGQGTRSALFTDRAATTAAAFGDTVLAIKSTDGAVTLAPSSDVRGPVYTKAGLLGNRPILWNHDMVPNTAGFFSTGFSATATNYIVAITILTPRSMSSLQPGGISAITNQGIWQLNISGPLRGISRRNATGFKWGGWGQTPGWIEANDSLVEFQREILFWQYFNDGAQKLQLWRNGEKDTLDTTYAYPTSLTSLAVLINNAAEHCRLGLLDLQVWTGTASDDDLEALYDAMNAEIPAPSVSGTHTSLSTFNLDTKGNGEQDGHQGYSRDAAGNHYTTRSGQIRKFNAAGTVLANVGTTQAWPISGQSHTGGCCHHDGLLYVVSSEGVSGNKVSLQWHDANTLARVGYVDITKDPVVAGDGAAVAVDPKRNRIYCVAWSTSSGTSDAATKIWSYDLTTKEFVEEIAIGNIIQIEGASVRGDHIYFMSDDHTLWRMHLDHPGERELVCNLAADWPVPASHGSDIEMAAHNGVPANHFYVQIASGDQDNHRLVKLNSGPGMYYEASSGSGGNNFIGLGIGVFGAVERKSPAEEFLARGRWDAFCIAP